MTTEAETVAVRATVRLNAHHVISTAIEHACEYGVHRAYKYEDAPSRETIAEQCHQAVMNALAEVLDYGNDP